MISQSETSLVSPWWSLMQVLKIRWFEEKLGFMFESGVKSQPSWSKASNSNNIEMSGSDHPTWQMKSIAIFTKPDDNYKRVRVIPKTSFPQLNQVKNTLIFPGVFFLLFYFMQPSKIGITVSSRRGTKYTIGLFHKPKLKTFIFKDVRFTGR